jgi:16S rRNA (adenine1518-N6/adenine1519-N6)-dimethyltransferase
MASLRPRSARSGYTGLPKPHARRPNSAAGAIVSRSARRRFGQHFLEPEWTDKLIESLNTSPGDTFLEIGPGRGALTEPLAARVRRVIAVEIDRDLATRLVAHVPSNVHVVQADFLDLDLEKLLLGEPRPIRVAANLPYNVAVPIIFKLLRSAGDGRVLSDATLMLQREVAERLLARPGTRSYGVLSVQVSLLADVDRVLSLPPGAFRPVPKVASSVVRLRWRSPAVDVGDPAFFERVVRTIFLQRRKMLANALKPLAESMGVSSRQLIERSGVDGQKRPEALTLAEMARLSRAML